MGTGRHAALGGVDSPGDQFQDLLWHGQLLAGGIELPLQVCQQQRLRPDTPVSGCRSGRQLSDMQRGVQDWSSWALEAGLHRDRLRASWDERQT